MPEQPEILEQSGQKDDILCKETIEGSYGRGRRACQQKQLAELILIRIALHDKRVSSLLVALAEIEGAQAVGGSLQITQTLFGLTRDPGFATAEELGESSICLHNC
jgi:hypothetical protein